MFIALAVLTILLALAAAFSASKKLQRDDAVVSAIVGTVGVPERLLPVLAALELAGAVGIIAGLWIAPLGIAAAAGLVLYFVGAIIGHVRVGDTKGAINPAVPLILSIAVLVLRAVTL